MSNFWFFEIQNSDIPPEKSKKHRGFANFKNQISPPRKIEKASRICKFYIENPAIFAIFGDKNTLVNPSIFQISERDFGRILDIYPIILIAFLLQFWIFPQKNRFSSQKVQKNWKFKNGVKTALTPLFKELWAIFDFVKFKNQISPAPQKNGKSFEDLSAIFGSKIH